MKFAFCVEDASDEQVFCALLSNLLKTEVGAQVYPFPRGGWNKAVKAAHRVARMAHYEGLDGALFAIDNDGAVPHVDVHPEDQCRVCSLRREAAVTEVLGWPRPELPPLRYFFAVPVQTLETWLLIHRGHNLGRNIEEIGDDFNGRRKLKKELYEQEQPTTAQMVAIAVPLARQIDPVILREQSASFRHFAEQVLPPLPLGAPSS